MLAARGGFPGIGQMSEATSSARTVSRRASLTMLKFSGDEFDALELVYRPTEGPVDIGGGFSHLAVQIDNLKATVEAFPWSKQQHQTPRPRNRLNQAMTAHRIACQVQTVIDGVEE